jgi:hypothetical protein
LKILGIGWLHGLTICPLVTLLSTTKTTLVIPDPFHLSRRPVNLAFCLKLEEKILATLQIRSILILKFRKT